MNTAAYISLSELPLPEKKKTVFSKFWVRVLKAYELMCAKREVFCLIGFLPSITCFILSTTWFMRGVPDAGFPWAIIAIALILPYPAFEFLRLSGVMPESDIVEARYEFSKDDVLVHEMTVITSWFKTWDDNHENHIRGLDEMYNGIARFSRYWLDEMLRLFSFGHSKNHPKSLYEYTMEVDEANNAEALEIIKQMKREYRDALREFENLLLIWSGTPELEVLCLHVDEYTPEQLKKIGMQFGIEPMVDAYYSGVPIEDIIA